MTPPQRSRLRAILRSPLDVAPGEGHLWLWHHNDASAAWLQTRGERLLDRSDFARAEALQSTAERRRFLLSRASLRNTLSRHVPVAPAAWRFECDSTGRPAIAAPDLPATRGLSFNLAHTQGLTAIAVARDVRVGVDAECVLRPQRPESWRRALGEPEWLALHALAPGERHRRFLELWTLKESYLKARGVGLRLPPRQVAFRLEGRRIEPSLPEPPDTARQHWAFLQWAAGPHHLVSICVATQFDRDLQWHGRRGVALAWDEAMALLPVRQSGRDRQPTAAAAQQAPGAPLRR